MVELIESYDVPPREVRENLLWRDRLYADLERSVELRQMVEDRCRSDPVWFILAMGMTYQVKPLPLRLPMILYPIQERYVRLLKQQFDLLAKGELAHTFCDKSRGMGASWIAMLFSYWLWRFYRDMKILCASWKDYLVDSRGNPDSMFWKLDFIHEYLPDCFRPAVRPGRERKKNLLINPDNDSVITGESTTKKMARAGRNVVVVLDEFAHMGDTARDSFEILDSVRPTTDFMLIQSTPKGAANAFAHMKSRCSGSISLWWPDHPLFGEGLTGPRIGQGEEFGPLPDKPESGFWSDNVDKLRGLLSSPYHEREKAESHSDQYMAQEWDIDYHGSTYQYFRESVLKRILVEDVMEPFARGNLILDPESSHCRGFDGSTGRGPLCLWTHLRADGWPRKDRTYYVGADVAAGSTDSTGAGWSNSVAVVLDSLTREFVAEYTVHGMDAADFAIVTVALCRFFGDARLIWEGNGPGGSFSRVVTGAMRYGNIYYRRREKIITRMQTMEPGFWSGAFSKAALFQAYRTAIDKRHVIERSKEAVMEMRMYEETVAGAVHAMAQSSMDPTGARENHADRVVARALAWKFMQDDGYDVLEGGFPVPKETPRYSIAWLRQQTENRRRTEEELVY